ncbi:MAG TPA: DUF2167 domain-containing protein [Thermoanaerobaculia bacterium]|nr:DUF2167 domain-containing protein [Thermoanaerobaculia bacterium]
MSTKTPRFLFAAVAALALAVSASAQESPEQKINWVPGPTTAQLGDGLASIQVPEGYLFADKAETQKFMKMIGNPPSDQEIGLLTPADDAKTWFVVFKYNEVGYVKDDDKDDIDADAILDSIREGTEAANEERKEMGSDPIEIVGWFEKPHYDANSHNLVWAIEGKSKEDHVINYDVRLLGRRGYVSATLVTDPKLLSADLPHVQSLLGSFSFNDGNRYAEWKAGDKVAEYGLAALVAGGAGAAAMKLGLFAQLGKLLAKGGKLIVVGFAAVAAWVKRLFGRKQQDSETPIAP